MKKLFSLIALVGVFAACQPEDLTTAFQVAPASLTITATAKSAVAEFNEAHVTWSPSQTYTAPTNAKGGVDAGSVTFTATYDGASGSATVEYPAMLAGAIGTMSTVVAIPYDRAGYVISVVEGDVAAENEVKMLYSAAHGHGYPGAVWEGEINGVSVSVPMLANDNEYVLNDSYTYTSYAGTELVADSQVVLNGEFAGDVAASAALYDEEIVPTEVKKTFQVSAWALYNVVNLVSSKTVTMNVVATPKDGVNTPALPNGGVVGKFQILKKDSFAQPVEMAHPDHASHYVPGHGTGHENGGNAGGGLVEAE